jgi:hypothetical protein
MLEDRLPPPVLGISDSVVAFAIPARRQKTIVAYGRESQFCLTDESGRVDGGSVQVRHRSGEAIHSVGYRRRQCPAQDSAPIVGHDGGPLNVERIQQTDGVTHEVGKGVVLHRLRFG